MLLIIYWWKKEQKFAALKRKQDTNNNNNKQNNICEWLSGGNKEGYWLSLGVSILKKNSEWGELRVRKWVKCLTWRYREKCVGSLRYRKIYYVQSVPSPLQFCGCFLPYRCSAKHVNCSTQSIKTMEKCLFIPAHEEVHHFFPYFSSLS